MQLQVHLQEAARRSGVTAETSPRGPRLPAGPPPSPGQLGARVPPVADEDIWSVPTGLTAGAGQRGM